MSWPMVELKKLILKVDKWNPVKDGGDEQITYIDLSSVDKDSKAIKNEDVQKVQANLAPSRARQLVDSADILVATVRPNLNGVAIVSSDYQGATASTGYCVLRPNNKLLDSKYLFYWVQTESFISDMMAKATGANYPAVSDKIVKESQIPLPPLEEQKRIAAILDKADAIRQKRKQAIALADEFLRSVFLDMFGDPVNNPKGWPLGSMADFGGFKNGLNYSRDEYGVELSYIGVGDFKSHSKLERIDNLSKIQLNENPDDGYLLKDNDILFVRSNGNKALVGRCLTVHPGEHKVTFSGFCIRYRIQKAEELNPTFLNYCMRMPSMKNAMLKGGQGANIQNINQKTLTGLSLPIPPIDLQKDFDSLVRRYQVFIERALDGANNDTALFSSLSQKAFSGQL
ncbi:restriction endonuclease subunit S [Vibrio campbellii]|uniref:restriction endonuclease subunit S n=1 Tax=Vibrio campbellii TaxID=680 RepID=UPI000EFBA80F|nr:restriction endonuclease subunit S [Vibrio campbellii]AYO12434.1 restriction endonuclease subunit S [Vibrio campbellii]